MRIILMLVIGFLPFEVLGFNWKKCSSQRLGEASIFGVTTSSSQFTSSTGGCSAIGMSRDEQAQLFYAINYDKVLEDIARGRGEYYLSLSGLWGCGEEDSLKRVHPLRQEYSTLLELEDEAQYYFIKKHMKCKRKG